MKVKLYSLGLGIISVSLAFAACGGKESGGLVNNTNATRSNSNNTASVVPANNTTVVSTTNNNGGGITNIWSNAGNVTREEYNGRRAEYEKDRGESTIGQGANDSWLWFKTRAALLGANDLRDSTINVDVSNDVVTLRGTVASAAQKTRAEQVAKGIDGVKSVKNELKVAAADSITNVGGGGNTKGSGGNTNGK